MSDGLNQVGKNLRQTKEEANRAAKKASPEYGMGETARDIFDKDVEYSMTFNVVRNNQSVQANLQFELPPPNTGLGNCCGDCYCAVCDYFPADQITSNTLLLTKSYVAGSVRLFWSDFLYQEGFTEIDEEAGIIQVDNNIFGGSRSVTVCYVNAYDDCTTNGYVAPEDETPPDPPTNGGNIDDFENRTIIGAILPSGSDLGTSSTGYSEFWFTNGASDSVIDVADGILTMHLPTFDNGNNGIEITPVPHPSVNFVRSVRFKTDYIPSTSPLSMYLAEESNAYIELDANVTSGGSGNIELFTDNDDVTFAKTDWIANEWYTIEITVAGTTIEGRVWGDSETRPTDAQVIGTNDDSITDDADDLWGCAFPSLSTAANVDWDDHSLLNDGETGGGGGGGGAEEPPPSSGPIAQWPGSGPATEQSLTDLMRNTSVGIIEIAAGTYGSWECYLDVARPSDNPLLVRPAPGAAVVFDGTGTDNTPPFRVGWFSTASYITFDPAGTGGSFTIRNYNIGRAGLIMVRRCDHVAFNGFRVRNVQGTEQPQHSHCVYIDDNTGSRTVQHWTSNNWDVVGPANRYLNGFQTDHEPSGDHLTANNWTVSNLHRAAYLWSDPTDIQINGWTIVNCDSTFDNYPNTAQGVISNCRATNSGPLAPGRGDWRVGALVDGGGNTTY